MDNPKEVTPSVIQSEGGSAAVAPVSSGSEADPLIGKTVGGKYTIVSKLGRGAMGVVYTAEHSFMNRIVALKVLHAHLVHDEESMRRFQNEARTASRITHPNAVTLYDFGVEEGRPYLAMKLVQGKTLKSVLKEQGALTLDRIANFLEQVGGALEEAHSLGIVHRDLKPDNIMVSHKSDGKEWFEVLDFGIAKVLSFEGDPAAHSVTRTGMVIGTPQYMSPEQARVKELDRRADIYSLGVILYEMLTGDVPFRSESLMEMLMQHINDKPVPPRKFKPELNIPKEIERVVLRALEKDPQHRHQTVRELLEDFFGALPRSEEEARRPSGFGLAAGAALLLILVPLVTYLAGTAREESASGRSAESALGSINVVSKPSGATVRINGEVKGVTPLLVEGIFPGTYAVTVERDGFEQRSHELAVNAGLTYAMTFPLQPKAARVQPSPATAAPDAAIELAGLASEAALFADQPAIEGKSAPAAETVGQAAETASPPKLPVVGAKDKEPEDSSTQARDTDKEGRASAGKAEPVASPKTAPAETVAAPADIPTAEPPKLESETAPVEPTAEQLAMQPPREAPLPRDVSSAKLAERDEPRGRQQVVVIPQPNKLFKPPADLNIARGSGSVVPPAVTESPFRQAQQLYGEGNYAAAAARLEQVVAANKRNVTALNLLGSCYLKMGKHPNYALKKFQDAFRVDAHNAETRYNLAVAYAKLGNPSKVFQELEAAVSLDRRMRERASRDPAFKLFQANPRFRSM